MAAHLGCPPRAVQERLKKLKKLAAVEPAASDPTAAVAGPKTPTKAKTPTKSKATPAGDDAGTPTPKKRKVATPRSAKGGVKGGKAEMAKADLVVAEMLEAAVVKEEDGAVPGVAAEDGQVADYATGPEIDQAIKNEDLLEGLHDSVLYDAHIGLLANEL